MLAISCASFGSERSTPVTRAQAEPPAGVTVTRIFV